MHTIGFGCLVVDQCRAATDLRQVSGPESRPKTVPISFWITASLLTLRITKSGREALAGQSSYPNPREAVGGDRAPNLRRGAHAAASPALSMVSSTKADALPARPTPGNRHSSVGRVRSSSQHKAWRGTLQVAELIEPSKVLPSRRSWHWSCRTIACCARKGTSNMRHRYRYDRY